MTASTDEAGGQRPLSYETFETAPDYAELRTAVDAGSWKRAEKTLAALTPEAANVALAALADVEGIEAFLEASVAANPTSAMAATALANRYIVIGWNVRTGAQAQHVSAEQWVTFAEWLERAEVILLDVCAKHPEYALGWALRVLSARGLGLGKSEALRRFRRYSALAPHDYAVESQMMQFLLPKWYGSDDEALTFAREAYAAAPAGSNSGALVAQFYIERWSTLGGGDPGLAALSASDVRAELQAAAAASVLHESHVLDASGVQAHNTFAMAFWLGGHNGDAAAHARAIDGRVTKFPWAYFRNDATSLEPVFRELLGHDGAEQR